MAWFSLVFILPFLLPSTLARGSVNPCAYSQDAPPTDLQSCINETKRDAGDSTLFWFGTDWKFNCDHDRPNWRLLCHNPHGMHHFSSLGARLLHVTSFHSAYLKDLRIFPQVLFTSQPGAYTACSNVYHTSTVTSYEGFPHSRPIPSWHTRHPPTIFWDRMEQDKRQYIVLIQDVATQKLHYLVQGFPAKKHVLYPYQPLRHPQAPSSPFAVVVFEQKSKTEIDWKSSLDAAGSFSLRDFVIKNGLKHGFVGLSWFLVDSDAYALEHYRKSHPNICYQLVLKEFKHKDRHMQVLPQKSLWSSDMWIGARFESPFMTFQICCLTYVYQEQKVPVNPLGNGIILPQTASEPPLITVHLQQKHVKSYYTIIMFNEWPESKKMGSAERPFVHWLVRNIPGSELIEFSADDSPNSETIISYRPPMPPEGGSETYYIQLFKQDDIISGLDSDIYAPGSCPLEFKGRCQYDIRRLVSHQNLLLMGATWFRSEHSPFVKYRLKQRGVPEASICRSEPSYVSPCPVKPVIRSAPVHQSQLAGSASSLQCSGLFVSLTLLFVRP